MYKDPFNAMYILVFFTADIPVFLSEGCFKLFVNTALLVINKV